MSAFSPFAAKLAAIPVEEHTMAVLGVNTRYWQFGQASAIRTIVMIHGFRGDHHGLEPIVAELGSDIRVVIPDLPGFGASDALPGVSDVHAYSAWLEDFIGGLAIPHDTVILGHSFGSIVVAAALAQGLSAEKAILINPIAANALKGPNGFMTRLAVLYYKAAAALPERAGFALLKNAVIVRIMSITMAKTKDPELRTWIHGQHDAYFSDFASRASVLEAFETSVGNDVSQFIDAINARSEPVQFLLLVADRDDITALPEQKALAARISGARLEVVEGVGHLVHYEAPDFAARNIRLFLGLPAHP
ncbi:MAG: pimeloyl-ACP methyl ester carboxylesterase [Alpinimonas sp.]|jgi:pimeloyl-ACP methyl ester carboxylesterase